MDKLSETDLDFITDLFRINEKEARQVIDGKAFYNPLSEKIESKSALVSGDYMALANNIQNWINKEENRIRHFPGYDGIEPFIAFAGDTVEMIKQHHIEEEKKNTQEMNSTKTSNAQITVMEQFDQMKTKHPDAILLFRRGDFYETYKQDAEQASKLLNITTANRSIAGVDTKVAGFPHHALDTYLPKLVRAGMRVAICEQLEEAEKKQLRKDSHKEEPLSQNTTDMPKKKKEQVEQETPTKTAKVAVEEKPAKETKEQKAENAQERKPREPQMVTVNGAKVTHGHAFQSNQNPQDWYFTAKLDGVQLKPQKMGPADVVAYQKKELTVPQLMERYYPTKLQQKVPEEAYRLPNVIATANGNQTIEKFNVYKEKNEASPDFGKYKLYAQVGEQKVSTVASRQDLNAFFDRTATPAQLVERNFAGRLNIPNAYEQHKLPEGVDPKSVRISKDRNDGQWKVSVDLGEQGRTSRQAISFDDGFALFKTKAATREQIAAKYVGGEVEKLLSQQNAQTIDKSKSMKI